VTTLYATDCGLTHDEFNTYISELSYDRTVARGLVHRRNLSELFLTDSRRIDDAHFVAAAQIPAAHPYYSDHTCQPRAIDPLLLLECCRQAETHAVHAHYGTPADTKFVLRSWRLRLSGAAQALGESGPRELALAATTSAAQRRGSSLRGQRYAIDIILDGTQVGDAWMDVAYVPGDAYAAMRAVGRQAPPPSSDEFCDGDSTGVVSPQTVARNDPNNVLLLAPQVDGERIAAAVRVPGGHVSLFDHAQDHLPGMVLMEAGRQISVLAAERFAAIAPEHATVNGLEASFSAHAELDAVTTVTALRRPGGDGPGARTVHVTFEQEDRTVAEASFAIGSNRPAQERGAARSVRSRSPHARDRAAVLAGLGSWTPPHVVTNDMLAEELDTSDEWIRSRTGIRQRYVVSHGMSTSDVAIEAGRRALASTPLEEPVDALVLATSTPDRSCPATAPLVASRLDLGNVAAFDVAAVCTGFLYALATAAGLISSHVADSVLVIGADTFSTILDPNDRATRAIFGDGSGAVILRAGQADEPGAFLGFDLGSDGSEHELITVPAGGSEQRCTGRPAADHEQYFQMDGQPVFIRAVRRMTESTRAIIDAARWTPEQVDHLVAHQANVRILNACARELRLPRERIVCNLDRVGNTVAASIPLAMADAVGRGHLTPGERVVLTGFGGGLTWGATALTWPEIALEATQTTHRPGKDRP
jgi:3-oxoacyl-[acyl-carrier-protein] synthase III